MLPSNRDMHRSCCCSCLVCLKAHMYRCMIWCVASSPALLLAVFWLETASLSLGFTEYAVRSAFLLCRGIIAGPCLQMLAAAGAKCHTCFLADNFIRYSDNAPAVCWSCIAKQKTLTCCPGHLVCYAFARWSCQCLQQR